VNIIEDRKFKIIYMKYFNLFKLELEKLIRWFAYLIGIGSSVCSALVCVATFNAMENKITFNSEKIDASNTKSDLVFAILCVIIPLLISTFILVVTRKFKELNQLIEENNKL
jgi:hypothetical protein